MSSKTGSHKHIASLATRLHSRIHILELLALFVALLMLYINMRSEDDLAVLVITPLAVLGTLYYVLRYKSDEEDNIDSLIFKLSSFSSVAALFAITFKYMAWTEYDLFVQGAVFLLVISLIGITVMKIKDPRSKLFSTELFVRTSVLEITLIVLNATPNEKLVELGFALL